MKRLSILIALFVVCNLSAQVYEAYSTYNTDVGTFAPLKSGSKIIVTDSAFYVNIQYSNPYVADLNVVVPITSEPYKVDNGTAWYVSPGTNEDGYGAYVVFLGNLPEPGFPLVWSLQVYEDPTFETKTHMTNIYLEEK